MIGSRMPAVLSLRNAPCNSYGSTATATLQQWLDLEPDKAVFSGKAVYRGLLKRDEIPKESWDAMMRPDAAASTYRGPKKHIMTYPIGRTTDERPGKLLNLVVYVPDPDYDGSDSWTARGLVSDLEKEMDMFAEPVKAAIAALKVQSDTCWKQMLHYRSAIETWTDGRGLIIIGDAAQYVSPLGSRVVSQNDTSQSKSVAERSDRSAIPPHLGQGAAMALEDAVALATLLDGADHQNVVRRLEAAATLRQPRTTALLEASIKMGRVLDSQQADTLPKSDEAQMKTRQWSEHHAENTSKRNKRHVELTSRPCPLGVSSLVIPRRLGGAESSGPAAGAGTHRNGNCKYACITLVQSLETIVAIGTPSVLSAVSRVACESSMETTGKPREVALHHCMNALLTSDDAEGRVSSHRGCAIEAVISPIPRHRSCGSLRQALYLCTDLLIFWAAQWIFSARSSPTLAFAATNRRQARGKRPKSRRVLGPARKEQRTCSPFHKPPGRGAP